MKIQSNLAQKVSNEKNYENNSNAQTIEKKNK